jgi:hypothetical protein
LEIESFEERITQFEDETPVQPWYGEASFSGFGFDYGGMADAFSSHPPPFDSPPSAQTHDDDDDDDDEEEEDDDDE